MVFTPGNAFRDADFPIFIGALIDAEHFFVASKPAPDRLWHGVFHDEPAAPIQTFEDGSDGPPGAMTGNSELALRTGFSEDSGPSNESNRAMRGGREAKRRL